MKLQLFPVTLKKRASEWYSQFGPNHFSVTNFTIYGMKKLMKVQIMEAKTYIVGVDILIRNCMGLHIEALGQISLFGRVLCKFPRVRNSVRMHYFMH